MANIIESLKDVLSRVLRRKEPTNYAALTAMPEKPSILPDSQDYEAPYPHCDSLVLHAPGYCLYCDSFPGQQYERIVNRINFTGESDPNKLPDPATERRPLETIERWPGNRSA